MSQISATDDLRLRIRQRLEAAQPAAGADPLRMAIRQRLAAMQPQQPQPFSAGDPLGQGATGTQWPTQPSRSVLGEFTAAAESGIGRLAGMTGLVPMPDDFRPSPAPEGASRARRIAQTGAGIAGQAAPAVVAGIGTAGLAAPAVAGLGALAPAVGMSGTLASQMAGGAAAGLPAGALGAATTYERTGSPLAAAGSGILNTAAGAVPVFSATGRLPVNIAADAAIQGGTNVATAYGDEQIARAAGAAPMEVDPLAAFAAGAGMTAGTRGLPAAARAIGDRLPVRELPMGTLEPVDALAAYQDAYRNAPDPNAIPVQALSRADLNRLQPYRGPILGDSLPLSDGPTAAPIAIAPAEVNADPGIPLVSPDTPSAATLSLPALRAEAERLGVLRQGPRDRASLAQRVDQARAGIAVDDGTPKVPALYPDATQMVTTRSGGNQGGIETPPTDPLSTPVNVPGDTAPPEPWQMTRDTFVDSQTTSALPSDTYSEAIQKPPQPVDVERFPVFVRSFKDKTGAVVEIRRENRPLQYVKRDANGEILRDQDGRAVMLTDAEAAAKGLPVVSQNMVAVVDGLDVGSVFDSIGVPEVIVQAEYQKRGIGTELLKEYQRVWNRQNLGQATPQGRALIGGLHRESVRSAIASGRRVPPEVLADYPDLKPQPAGESAARTPSERAPNGNRLQEEGRPEGLLSPPRAETVTGAGEQPAPGIRATQNVAQPTAQPPSYPEMPDSSIPGDTAPPEVAARTPIERAPSGQIQEEGQGRQGLLSPEQDTGAGPLAPVASPERSPRSATGDVLSAEDLQNSRASSNLRRVGAGIADAQQRAFDRDVQTRVDAYAIRSQINPDHTQVGVEDVIRAFGWDESRARAALSDFRAGLPKEPARAPSTHFEFVDSQARRQMASSLPPANEPNQTVRPLPREAPLADMTLPEIRQEARQLGVFEGGPRSREALATRIEAARAERRRGRTTGEDIGLKQSEIDRIRTETGLSELPEPERRGWEEVLNRARNEGQADKAIQTANEVVKSGRPTTDVEHAGMVLKAAELANDYDAAIADMNRLIDSRDDGGARLARERANSIMQQIETLTDASDQGGREAARALSIRRMLINRESFELAPVVQRAQQVKGSKLTSAEHAKLEAVTKAHAEAEARVKELESKWREAELAKARAEAKRTLEREARTREVGKLREQAGTARSERDAALREASQTSKASERLQTELAATQKALADAKQARTHARTERISTTRQKLATERQEILAKIRALGYRANAGFDPTFYYHLGRLAINYVHEGVLTLDEVVAKVREHVPDATDRDVYEALNARDPKRQARARSDAQKRVQELRTQARLLAKIDRASAGMLDTPKAKPPASQQIRALRSQLTQLRVQAYKATADATKLERAAHLITEIQNHLDNGTRPAAAAKKGSTTPAELQQARQKIRDLKSLMRATDQIASLRQQIQSGEFVIPETAPVREVPRELDRARIELRKARSAVRQAIEEQRPWTTRRAVAESMNTLRAVKATADVSATLRQGLVLGASRPGTAIRAFGKAVRAMLDANTELQIDDAIRSRPTHYLGERAGLYLSDVQGAPNAREEAFMSNLVRKVPILKQVAAASERHMTTYLNLLRTAAFDQFVAANPNATQAELKAWAAFVNVASGRGDLGRAAAISGELSTVIFSPRFTVSRFQTPWHLVKAGQSPRVRKAIAKDIAATLAIGGTALTLAAAAGFTVGTDPRESDFGKFRVGNTTVDVWGGLLQPARLIVGTAVSGTDRAGLTNPGKLGPTSPLELISRFAMTKLSPGVTVPLEVGFGVNVIGQETDRLDSAARAVVPLLFSDIYDAYQQGGDANALGVAVGSSLGLGMHTMTDAQIRKMEKRKRDREMTR